MRLFECQCEYSAFVVTAGEDQSSVVQAHYLAGETQSDAGAFLLGGEEWDEDLVLALAADRGAVVIYIYHSLFGCCDLCADDDRTCLCLDSVPDQIDKDLGYLSFVGI